MRFPCLNYPLDASVPWIHKSELIQLVLSILVFIRCLIYLSHIYLYLNPRHCFQCMLSDSDLLIYMYLLDFRFIIVPLIFIYVTSNCLYLYAWITSLDHVHVWLPEHANWLYLMYSLGCFLTALDPHVQILKSGPWWPYCSWSEYAAEAWISSCLPIPSFFQPPLDRLARFSSCYSWVLSCLLYYTSYFCASWWFYILEILYLALW